MFFAFDTNVYIAAMRDPRARVVYDRAVTKAGNRLRLPAIVAMELRAGVRNEHQRDAVEALVNTFESRDRLITPTTAAFLEAGRILANLAINERYTYAGGHPLVNDALIATTCRENKVTLVTGNHGDFAGIQRYLRGFRFVDPESLA